MEAMLIGELLVLTLVSAGIRLAWGFDINTSLANASQKKQLNINKSLIKT